MITIIDVTKEEMITLHGNYYFGYTLNHKNGNSDIWLCKDLPKRIYESVKAHEMQHAKDHAFLDGRVWYWEWRAWKAQFKADFIGTMYTFLLSITDITRVKLYLKRI